MLLKVYQAIGEAIFLSVPIALGFSMLQGQTLQVVGVVNPTPPIEKFLAQRGFWERGDELQYASLEHPTHALLDSGPEIWMANPSFEYSHSGDIH
ncbi:hypothetical protein LAZ67_22001309 [Cordylochernes scorpioides]|uniref:Uncharacterized protein n=1 Tax=Cordylochernes scorpioides TaxID=51811 RepID=A0ABY6LP57_9ARAC|nr:hypothetical protein LAZ67_22001309 [Cordylochernes scorpioides]